MADNNQSRILTPRKRLHGSVDSLENIIGPGVGDGVGCYVIEAGANYRYHAQCDLEADGYFVVKPNGTASGKWLRESGSLATASLRGTEGGDLAPVLLVQFTWEQEGRERPALRYVGRSSRPAQIVIGGGIVALRSHGSNVELPPPMQLIAVQPQDLLIPEAGVNVLMVACL